MSKTLWGACGLALLLAGCGQGGDDGGTGQGPSFEVGPVEDPNAVALAAMQAQEEARLAAEFDCMDRVLRADKAVPVSYMPDQTAAMRAISTEGCPAEFQVAYVTHVQAWEKTIRIDAAIRQLDTGGNLGSAFLAEIVGEALGVQSGAIESHFEALQTLRRERGVASQQISDTFEIVTTLARNRGVTIPA